MIMDSILEPKPHVPTPHTIIEDCNEFWRICFKPDIAGIIRDEPRLISKIVLSDLYPHLIEVWEAQQEKQRNEAHHMEQKFLAFTRRFYDDRLGLLTANLPEPGVPCDQQISPSMKRHWGELKPCATHPQDQAPFRVCKGCRVNHQMQPSTSYDRQLITTRGARVSVCSSCASQVSQQQGADHRRCICDSKWTCSRCREAELVKLSRARIERHQEGRCGRCMVAKDLIRHVDVCLSCQKIRVYTESSG